MTRRLRFGRTIGALTIGALTTAACTSSDSVDRLPNDATYADLVSEYPDETRRFNEAEMLFVDQAPAHLPDLSTAPAADELLDAAHALMRVLPDSPSDEAMATYASHVDAIADLIERHRRGDFTGLDPLISIPLP